MLFKFKNLVVELNKDQGGSYFVEMALVLIGVAFVVFTAASGLATNGIVPKYTGMTTEITSVPVPDLNP